mmetsp:Transcript_36083/g.103845  ORF Transcript_36083/g.103845 Transcript_36083/m.103845 type:complete len:246 (-) Transcript_36083:549-1286(-)
MGGVGDDVSGWQVPDCCHQWQPATDADEEPPSIVADDAVLFALAVGTFRTQHLRDEVADSVDIGVDRAGLGVQQSQPLFDKLHIRLPLQEHRDGLGLLGVAVIDAARGGLRVDAPLAPRRIPNRVLRFGSARIVLVHQVRVERRLERRGRRLLVAKHGLQLPLLHFRRRVVLVAENDPVGIVRGFFLLLLLGDLLGELVELGVVRGVLLDKLVLGLLVADLPRLFRPLNQVLVAGFLVEPLLEHL